MMNLFLRKVFPGLIRLPLVLCFYVSISLSPAMAIPKEKALEKLNTVSVFLIVDKDNNPVHLKLGEQLIQKVYLDLDYAQDQLKGARRRPSNKNKGLKVYVTTFGTVWSALDTHNASTAVPSSSKLALTVVSSAKDRELAVALLRNEGLSEKEIQDGLNAPVFFTDPPLATQTAEGLRTLLFLGYNDLLEARAKASDPLLNKAAIKVADINNILQVIIAADQDSYVFYPTKDTRRITEAVQEKP